MYEFTERNMATIRRGVANIIYNSKENETIKSNFRNKSRSILTLNSKNNKKNQTKKGVNIVTGIPCHFDTSLEYCVSLPTQLGIES